MNYTKQEPLIKLEDVSLSFQGKQILRDINIQIDDIVSENTTGQVTTLLGKSGVGKTQLFKIIAGLMKPTTGTVKVGHPLLPVEPGKVGMVLQSYPLFKHYTLWHNLTLVCSDKPRIEAYLAEFDLLDHKEKYPSQMSGGQRQRTAIVQQLLSSEHFTLLDEPFSGLDPIATDKLTNNILKMVHQDSFNTVIISTHILEPAIAISDSIWILGHEYKMEPTDLTATPERYQEPGATILYNEDLASQGLAWNPEIRKDHRFHDMIEKVREIFKTL